MTERAVRSLSRAAQLWFNKATVFFLAPASQADRWVFFGFFVLLTLLRLPDVVVQGRFWAEEGAIFYAHAALVGWWRAIFFSWGGYLNLGANLAGALAWHLAPLQYAPRVTLANAMAVQLCPGLLLVMSQADWLRRRVALAAALLLLVAAPSAEEVWLNTLHSQFFLAVCTGLILALEIQPGKQEMFRRVLLFFAPLHGLVAITALPLFGVRALLERSRARLWQFVALGAGAAIQLAWFFEPAARTHAFNPPLILGMFYAKNIVLPLLGFGLAGPVTHPLRLALARGVLPAYVLVAIGVAAAVLAVLLRRAPEAARWLAAAAAVFALFSYYGILSPLPEQVEPHHYERYAFAPQVLFAWAILVAAGQAGWRGILAAALTLCLCVTSVTAYLRPNYEFAHGPVWSVEVARHRADPDYAPQVWPGRGWVVPAKLAGG